MDKQNVAYTRNEILLSHKKEKSTVTCYKMNEPWKYYIKQKKPDIKSHILPHITKATYVKYPEQINP